MSEKRLNMVKHISGLSKVALVIIFLSSLIFAYQGDKVVYKRYVNARFEYAVDYPEGLLLPQGEADNSDGQKFIAQDKSAEMIVYGSYNIDEKTPKELYNAAISEAQSEGVITYKVMKNNFFVISGKHNGKIFYHKTLIKGDIIKILIIEYNESLKAQFDPITASLSNSFKHTKTALE